jgi:lipoprotein-releasing system permease protein
MISKTTIKYFFSYILRAKTRQRLLFLAVFGLIISSFALIVLQSTMKGLQGQLIDQSKSISGHAEVLVADISPDKLTSLKKDLLKKGINSVREYEVELLMRYKNFITPVILHGIEPDHFMYYGNFFETDPRNTTISLVLSDKLKIRRGDEVKFISPSHVNSFFGDIPRSVTSHLQSIVYSGIPDIDQYHAWVRLSLVQNLVRKPVVNKLRIMGKIDRRLLVKMAKDKLETPFSVSMWEDKNATLVWALRLETIVMVFLFVAMTFLVSLCITSGLFIFFDRVKNDLSSLWIMGASEKNIEKASKTFLFAMGGGSVIFGLTLGLAFLYILDRYGEYFPSFFGEDKIPVEITGQGLAISFFIPFFISIAFSLMTYRQYKKETNYLALIRSVGG